MKDALLNAKLAEAFGVSFNWTSYITSIAINQAKQFANSGILDDIVTDVTSDLWLQAADGGLLVAITKAKNQSENDEQLLHNVQGVVRQAAVFRIRDQRRKWNKWQWTKRFSEISKEDNELWDIPDRPHLNVSEYHDYQELMIEELESMAKEARKVKTATRYRLAAQMIPARMNGMKFKELRDTFHVNSKAKMMKILEDIAIALKRVATRLGDNVLLEGLKKQNV